MKADAAALEVILNALARTRLHEPVHVTGDLLVAQALVFEIPVFHIGSSPRLHLRLHLED